MCTAEAAAGGFWFVIDGWEDTASGPGVPILAPVGSAGNCPGPHPHRTSRLSLSRLHDRLISSRPRPSHALAVLGYGETLDNRFLAYPYLRRISTHSCPLEEGTRLAPARATGQRTANHRLHASPQHACASSVDLAHAPECILKHLRFVA
jgi:hypothetical protein